MVPGRPFMPSADRHQFQALVMGPKKLSSAQLPALELTEADEDALRELANDLEREVVDVYEEFLFAHDKRIDTLRWKPVKSHQDLRVYCERDVSMRSINRLQPFFPSGRAPPVAKMGPQGRLAEDTRVPIKMVSGTVVGTLDDAMLGGTIHDTPSLRMRTEYQREVLQDSAVLNVIDEACDHDPYRFLGVIWYLKSMGIPGISDRDMLVLAQTKLSELSTGERIGVHLYHSIEHEDLPEFTDRSVLRMHVSLVIIFRQIDDRCVDVFMLDVMDAKGSTPTVINVQESAKTLVASANICATGVKKKLHWCMRDRQRKRSLSRLQPMEIDESTKKTCCVCNKSCGGFFSGPSSLCQLCRKLTCAKCTINQQIIISATETELESKPFGFCRVCFIDAKNRSTFQVARAEMYERQMVRDRRALSDRPASDAGTSSSTSVSR